MSRAFAAVTVVALCAVTAAQQSVEQTTMGTKPGLTLVTSFDGLGYGFAGPQGSNPRGNTSDNSLSVGPSHVVQIVTSQMAVFTRAAGNAAVTHAAEPAHAAGTPT